MENKLQRFFFIRLILLLQCLSVFCFAQGFDFFYFVQQWPGSYCDTDKSCCYPSDGKPAANFGIHGLWPNNDDGSYPSNCDSSNPFDQSKVSDLLPSMKKDWSSLSCPSNDGATFWSHEWDKHGTCAESTLDQHAYFKSALNLKKSIDLLHILESAGIQPDGNSYSLSTIKSAIQKAIGSAPWIECNTDDSGNSQMYQIYVCIDTSGSNVIECPVMPSGKCSSDINFPSF